MEEIIVYKTGDTLQLNGKSVRIGLKRHGLIDLHYTISVTSGYTVQVTHRQLIKMIKEHNKQVKTAL